MQLAEYLAWQLRLSECRTPTQVEAHIARLLREVERDPGRDDLERTALQLRALMEPTDG